MRATTCVWVGLTLLATPAGHALAADRFGVAADPKGYPQATPKETLEAVARAAEARRFDYLLAHLADPDWVDGRVQAYAGGFAELVKETAAKLDPGIVKQLRRFLKDGEFETRDAATTVRLQGVKDRAVRLRKVEGQWFLQNAFRP